jgi:hypothetical protein
MFRVTVPVNTIGWAEIDVDILSVTDAPMSSAPIAGGLYQLFIGLTAETSTQYDIYRWHTLGKTAHFSAHLHASFDLPRTVTSFVFRLVGYCEIGSNTAVRGVHYRWDYGLFGALRT